ncbi:MAG: hypothetical protein NW201_03205 [Gemmatimonadales bacterium]|nr:hypothetical protein [Gemmatimonadales bacterium]
MNSDRLAQLLARVLPRASASEVAQLAERLGTLVGDGASWVGETAEHATRRLEELLESGAGPDAPGAADADAMARRVRWLAIAAELAPRVAAAEARARALPPDADPTAEALAADIRWLAAELRSAWERASTLPGGVSRN